MAQTTGDLMCAHKTAAFVERRARGDLSQTLERVAGRLEHAATALRRMGSQNDVPVTERVGWAQHEIAALLSQLDGADEHLAGLALVWTDAGHSTSCPYKTNGGVLSFSVGDRSEPRSRGSHGRGPGPIRRCRRLAKRHRRNFCYAAARWRWAKSPRMSVRRAW